MVLPGLVSTSYAIACLHVEAYERLSWRAAQSIYRSPGVELRTKKSGKLPVKILISIPLIICHR